MESLIIRIKNTGKSLVIAPSSYHVPIMLNLNKGQGLYDVKYLTRERFISSNSFELKKTALVRLCKELDLSPTVVVEIINYLPYLNDQDEEDLTLFFKTKRLLTDFELIEEVIPFTDLNRNRKIYIFGYPSMDNIFLQCLNALDSHLCFEILNFEHNSLSTPLTLFNSEYAEVEYLCNTISEKISEGVDPSNIKVHVTSASYKPIICTLFDRYYLQPYFSQPTNLLSLNITNQILNMIRSSDKNIEETLLDIYPVLKNTLAYQSEESNKIFMKYLGVLNTYILFEGKLKDYIKLIEYDLQKATTKNKRVISSVFIGDLTSEFIHQDDVVYILGFNEGDIPHVTKNNGILDDSVLSRIGAETSIENTMLSKKKYMSLVLSNNIGYISYSTHSLTSEKNISTLSVSLIKKGKLHIDKPRTFSNHYSLNHDLITLGKMISDTKEYGIITDELGIYANSVLENIEYPEKFKQKTGYLKPHLTSLILKDIPSLSYSSINDYFKCSFKFLLKKALKIPETFGDRLPIIIGTLFHNTLQKVNDIPTEKDAKHMFFKQVLSDLVKEKDYDLSKKESFYLTHSFKQLTLVVDWIKEINDRSLYSPLFREKEYIIPLKGEFIKQFKGIIDVVMTLDNNFFIVDYKTGSTNINISNLEFGLESQLIFYLYLVDQVDENLSLPSGFFYSPVYSKLLNAKVGKTYEQLLLESWKLVGYVSEEKLADVDSAYFEDSFIKGVKAKKNSTELKKGAKLLSAQKQYDLIRHLETLIDQAVIDMETGRFDVNPKGSELSSQSCSYCEYKDICFKTKANFIELKTEEKNSLLFLEGGELYDS